MPGGITDFADIYHYASKLGFSPPEVDEWYVWQTAVVFGTHMPDDGPTRTGPSNEPTEESKRLIAARLAHARGEGPKPEARAYRPEELGAVIP